MLIASAVLHDFWGKFENKFVHRFSLQLMSDTFLILRGIQRDSITNVNVKHPLSCQIITKLEFSQNIFEKYSNIKFHEHPSSGSRRAVPCGRTDRNDEANSRFSQFGELAGKRNLVINEQMSTPIKQSRSEIYEHTSPQAP